VRRRLPSDAFAFYLNLGVGRSYEAVSNQFGVSKRAVVKRGVREHWQEKVAEVEAKARAAAEQRAFENLAAMNERHLKSLRVIQGKALETLRAMPLDTAMNAVRSLDLSIRQERLIRGEPADGAGVDLEKLVRREHERWMLRNGDDPADADDAPTNGTQASESPNGNGNGNSNPGVSS
jgi:transposase-like protein